jgi:hypothetical protein
MHAKKSLTSSHSLPFNAKPDDGPALPAIIGKALGAAQERPDGGAARSPGRSGGNVRTDQPARGAKPGVHVTKTEVPRSGHR